MRIEILIFLIVALIGGFILFWLFGRKEYDVNFSANIENRKKSTMPNTFAKYPGQNETQDTLEYTKIINSDIISLLR